MLTQNIGHLERVAVSPEPGCEQRAAQEPQATKKNNDICAEPTNGLSNTIWDPRSTSHDGRDQITDGKKRRRSAQPARTQMKRHLDEDGVEWKGERRKRSKRTN